MRAKNIVRNLSASTFMLSTILSIGALAKSAPPGLSDVLQGSSKALDINIGIMGIFALSLATLSLAKGYEIFNRNFRARDGMELLREENNRLLGLNSDLMRDNDGLRQHSKKLDEILKERAAHEELLIRNTNNIKKECEKLIEEKESLAEELERTNRAILESAQTDLLSVTADTASEKMPMPIAQESESVSILPDIDFENIKMEDILKEEPIIPVKAKKSAKISLSKQVKNIKNKKPKRMIKKKKVQGGVK